MEKMGEMKLTQLIETKEEQEKREELELYIQVQEETYVDYAAKVEIARDKLHKHYKELEKKYEQKRQALIVVEAKLEFDLEWWRELEWEIETLKYKHTMGEDKVWAIMRHKEQMHQMLLESLEKGWKTWLNYNFYELTMRTARSKDHDFSRWMR